MVREARKEDLDALLKLYLFLHEDSIPEYNAHLEKIWAQIIEDPNHHLIVNEIDGRIVSSCVCVVIPNLTRNVRPYAFIENVVTHTDYRGNGYAGECLNFAKQIAEKDIQRRNIPYLCICHFCHFFDVFILHNITLTEVRIIYHMRKERYIHCRLDAWYSRRDSAWRMIFGICYSFLGHVLHIYRSLWLCNKW